ncbi:MAG: hypothetical protein MUF34_05530 [Polyangiaceae bacterium]|jgi:hypothetical protein|nr:hypothetical protein [Polyangiaceae bacterium]
MLFRNDLSALRSLRSLLIPLALVAGCAPSPDEAVEAEAAGADATNGAEAEGQGQAPAGAPLEGARGESAASGEGAGASPQAKAFGGEDGLPASAAPGGESIVRNPPAPSPAVLANYQVGPGKPYADLQALASKLKPGDVVDVYPKASGAYAGNLVFTKAGTAAAKITIRGVRVNGARPAIAGGATTVEFRANHYVFQGFDLSGGTSRVIFHHADNITVRDTVVHDCPQHGILGADQDSGSLSLEYVEVARCGAGDQKHPIYIATDESAYPNAVFRMQHSYVHDGRGGNNIKSRAGRNEIYYNWIEGAYYRELELIGPDGQDPSLKREDSDVVGNVFYQTTQGTYAVRVGGDGTGSTSGRYRFLNNTFVLRAGESRAAVQAFDEIETLELHNNVFFRLGGTSVQVLRDTEASWVSGAPRISGSKNWVPSGSNGLPGALLGTVTSSNPGFVNAAGRDLRLAAGSPLLNVGAASCPSPSGYAFPAPLARPAFLPPAHVLQAFGTASPRPVSGVIDVGAFE